MGPDTFTPNIRRKRFFDNPKTRFSSSTKESFMHPIEKLSKPISGKSCCSDSWAIAPVTCLADLYGLRDGTNPDLDYSFVMSCYAPRNFSKYYTSWGCNGDSPYNAILFLYSNGTVKNNCWNSILETDYCATRITQNPQTCSRASITCPNPELYKIGESELPGKNPDAFNISPLLGPDNKLLWSDKSEIPFEKALSHIRYHVERGPVIACFPIRQSFLTTSNSDWDPATGIYTPRTGPIVGSHCAVIVGWGPNYWILRNSWGPNWNPSKDTPPGYWKHAIFTPQTALGSVEVSLSPNHPLLAGTKLPGNHSEPIGGAISIGISPSDVAYTLNVSKLNFAPYIRDSGDIYPDYLWITLFVILVLLSSKMFI